MPLGENMEKPEEDPDPCQQIVVTAEMRIDRVPIYLVSPQLFVTREHIISERASTSSSFLPDFGGSGEGSALAGVETAAGRGVPLVGEASCTPGVLLPPSDKLLSLAAAAVLSANLFSRVPRSVAPESSSDSRPESLKRDSMRPNRFSRPSMYFALVTSDMRGCIGGSVSRNSPFRWVALLLHLGEDAFRFVVLAM